MKDKKYLHSSNCNHNKMRGKTRRRHDDHQDDYDYEGDARENFLEIKKKINNQGVQQHRRPKE
jgi:hypothetical protein